MSTDETFFEDREDDNTEEIKEVKVIEKEKEKDTPAPCVMLKDISNIVNNNPVFNI